MIFRKYFPSTRIKRTFSSILKTPIKVSFLPAVAVFFVSVSFLGCDLGNLTVPKKVGVKSDAKYDFSLGSAEISAEKYLEISSLTEMLSDPENRLSMYDYAPEQNNPSQVKQLILNYSLAEIPLDFSEYMADLDFAGSFGQAISQSFKIPSGSEINQTIELPDFNSLISDKFEADDIPLIVPEGVDLSTGNVFDNSLEFNINSPDFDTLEFKSGKLTLNIVYITSAETSPAGPTTDKNGPSADFTLELQMSFKDASGKTVTSTKISDPRGGTVEFDLSGVALSPETHITVEANATGGKLGRGNSYLVKMGLSDVKLSKVTGVTISNEDMGEDGKIEFEQTVSLEELRTYLVRASIGEGSLEFASALPENWTGIICDPSVDMSGGLNLSNESMTDGEAEQGKSYIVNKKVNLENCTLNPSFDLTLKGTVKIALDNATVIFDTEQTNMTLELTGAFSVKKLNNAEVKIENIVKAEDLSTETSVEIPAEIKTYVEELTFKSVNITGDFETNLPNSNIVLSATILSNALAFAKEDRTAPSGSYEISNPDDVFEIKTDKNWSKTLYFADLEKIDFTVETGLKGVDENGNDAETVEISELETDFEYKIDASINAEYDWKGLVIKTTSVEDMMKGEIELELGIRKLLNEYFASDEESEDGTGSSTDGTTDGSTDGTTEDSSETDDEINKVIQDLVDSIEFTDIGLYLYAMRPEFVPTEEVTEDPLESISHFSGKVKIEYGTGTDENGDPLYADGLSWLLGEETAAEKIELIQSEVNFESLADENGLITSDELYQNGKYSASLDSDAVLEVINKKADNTRISYDMAVLSADGVEDRISLDKKDVEALQVQGGSTSIKCIISIVLPIKLRVTNDVVIEDALKLAGSEIEEDLLNREEASSEDDVLYEISEIIERFALKYKFNNGTGLNLSAAISDSASGLNKTLEFSGDHSHTLSLTADEMKNIFTTYPFTPKVGVTLGAGDISLPRDAVFGVEASVSIETNGEYTIFGGE